MPSNRRRPGKRPRADPAPRAEKKKSAPAAARKRPRRPAPEAVAAGARAESAREARKPLEPEVVEPVDPELVEPEEPVVGAAVELELWARAGSCPETSWTKITPQIKANVEAAIATVRLRIKPMRRRRAFRRAVTPPGTLGCRSSARWDVVVEVS